MTPLQIETFLALRNAIAQESGLIAYTLWGNNQSACALGSLKPRAERKSSINWPDASDATVLAVVSFHKDMVDKFDVDVLRAVVDVNNDFEGSELERKIHVLNWIEQKLSNQLAKEVTEKAVV